MVSRRAISDAIAAFMVDSPIFRLCFPSGLSLSPPAFLRHREPDSREKLKAWVTRVCRDFGPLVQNAGQARASTAAIRSRRCWLGRSERDRLDMAYPTGLEKCELKCFSSPGLCMPFGEELISENWVRLSLALRVSAGVRQSWAIATRLRAVSMLGRMRE